MNVHIDPIYYFNISIKCFDKKYVLYFQTREGVEYLMLTPDRCLIFPSVDYVRNLVTKHSIRQAIPVVIDCSHIYGADFTAAKVGSIVKLNCCNLVNLSIEKL